MGKLRKSCPGESSDDFPEQDKVYVAVNKLRSRGAMGLVASARAIPF